MKTVRYILVCKGVNVFKDNRSYKKESYAKKKCSEFSEIYNEEFSVQEIEIEDEFLLLKTKNSQLDNSVSRLSKALLEVLAFGSPKPEENPTMFVAWEKAHKVLSECAPDSIISN